MKNPLNKRFPRELKSDFGKYVAIFIFVTLMTGFVSGFLIAGDSMKKSYNESYEKYNIEDGNFELTDKAEGALFDAMADEGITLYENFYIEEKTTELDSTLRIFANRNEVNLICLMSGELPKATDEIAIDRVYAKNNNLSVGDTITAGSHALKITGFVALSDYSTLFQSPSDMMFDTVKFGVGIMTADGFYNMPQAHIHYSYSWKYDHKPEDDAEAKTMSEDMLPVLAANASIKEFIPAYINQAIIFAIDDIVSDGSMMPILLYIILVIIAFIFAILTNNTISREANVIGTLRASGYTRGELIRHYITMPMLITLIAAITGNILGYTVFKNMCADMYYGSYSLTTYETVWNADAFVKTTVIPLIIICVINLYILWAKLKLSPLKFIRRDLSRKKKKKAFRLNTKIGIMTRFRIRIIFQNIPNYVTIIIGMFLANAILLFGMGLTPMMDHYQQEIIDNMIARHQYILKMPVETTSTEAEKYCSTTLKTVDDNLKAEDATIFGISTDSSHVDISFKNGVYISNAYAEKYKLKAGDTVSLFNSYENKTYSFAIDGIYDYPAGITVFMDMEQFNDAFDMQEGYFTGYFSDEEITDIDDTLIAAEITEDELTKTSRQLTTTFREMAGMVQAFGIVFFMLVIYLLSRIIIEKNAQSISMTKILGYSNAEINGLYIASTAIVVVLSIIVTIPVVNIAIAKLIPIAMKDFSGYFFYYVPFDIFVKMALLGFLCYGIIAWFQTKKVKKIPLDIALKNVE
ncbi:MAG: ABC transporter permease [Clostridium sp.]|nr:ABC transporter permease [Clostridium sp.]